MEAVWVYGKNISLPKGGDFFATEGRQTPDGQRLISYGVNEAQRFYELPVKGTVVHNHPSPNREPGPAGWCGKLNRHPQGFA